MEQTIEDKAKAQGWVPKEEFRGGEENHKTAEEFLAVGEKISGVQKERNDKLLTEVRELKKQNENFTEMMKDFKDTHSKEMKATREDAYNRAMLDLKEKQLKAVAEADVDEFEKTQKEIGKLEKANEPIKKEEPISKELPKEFVSWQSKNDWYGKDKELTEWADFEGGRLANVQMPAEEWYGEVEKRVKEKYPDKFKTKTETPDVESSTTGGTLSKPNGGYKYKDLPSDAKKACDRYVKQGLYKDKESYVKEYYGE